MNQPKKHLQHGIISMLLLIPLPTFIMHIYHHFQTTGEVIIFNHAFSGNTSYLILGYFTLLSLYLLHKATKSLSHFLLSI